MAELSLKELLKKLENPIPLIEEDEKIYKEKIQTVAKRICESHDLRVVLLAGPSGSGKTTTANLLCDRVRELGEKCMVVSLDNFYKAADDPTYPTLPDGTRDFESPYALNIDTLLGTLGDIIAGREFSVPRYDFKIGGCDKVMHYESFADGCVIIEGIHGLNPILSDPFPKESVLKLFVSVSTNINYRGRRLLSGRKLRFIRRTVRDNIYRASDAVRTLGMWENVLLGEDMYLYPYKPLADIRFDTFHTFECGVMKPYIEKLLTDEVVSKSKYAESVKKAVDKISAVDCSLVPEDSLIREFIPGGIYEDLY